MHKDGNDSFTAKLTDSPHAQQLATDAGRYAKTRCNSAEQLLTWSRSRNLGLGITPKPPGVFTETRVREVALVLLGSKERDDYSEAYLDRDTGDFITATYMPRTP